MPATKHTTKYAWDAAHRRYTQKRKPVPEAQVRDGLQRAIDSGKAKIGAFTQELVDGKINAAEWAVRMRDEIRAAHRAASLLANGGTLDASAVGKLGAVLKSQYGYLDRFRVQIENEEISLGARTVARARLYGQAVLNTYDNAVVARERKAGVKMGVWVLTAAEHCEGCLEQAAKGERPLKDIPPIGSQDCKSNCKCYVQPVGVVTTPGEKPAPLTDALRKKIQTMAGVPGDDEKVAVADLGLPFKEGTPPFLQAKDTKMNVPLKDIALGRSGLDRKRLLAAADSLAKDGIKLAGGKVEPLRLAQRPDGTFVVLSDGNHRVAALKLMKYKGDVPALVRLQKEKKK